MFCHVACHVFDTKSCQHIVYDCVAVHCVLAATLIILAHSSYYYSYYHFCHM